MLICLFTVFQFLFNVYMLERAEIAFMTFAYVYGYWRIGSYIWLSIHQLC